MSAIHDVKQIPGFDQKTYELLLETAKSCNVSDAEMTADLLTAVSQGKDFFQALSTVLDDLPSLVAPKSDYAEKMAEWTALPSPGAYMMLLMIEATAETRRQNVEENWKQTEYMVELMLQQVDKMKEAAYTQMIMGMVSAAVNFAGSLVQAKVAASGGKNDGMAAATRGQAFGSAFSSFGKIFECVGTYASSVAQAEVKGLDARIEALRVLRDSLKELNASLKELNSRIISTSDGMQQSKNQALSRVFV